MFAIKNIKTGKFLSKKNSNNFKSVNINDCSTYRTLTAAKCVITSFKHYVDHKISCYIDDNYFTNINDLEIVEVLLIEK